VETEGLVQPGGALHLQQLPGKACEAAEAIGTGPIPDADGKESDPGGPQLREDTRESLGIFEAVEIPQLGEKHHQTAMPPAHPRHIGQIPQQWRGSLHRCRVATPSLSFILSGPGQDHAELLGDLPLPPSIRQKALEQISRLAP
jgi:hypothetical protein